MENKQQSGICAYCKEESDRLFTPPLIAPPDWGKVTEREIDRDGTWAWWRCPVDDRSYSGKELFEIITLEDGTEYLRPYESPNEPICWECFCGQLWPALQRYTMNWPPQFKRDGWKMAEWVEVPA